LWNNPEGWMRQGILHFAEERRDEAQWLLERAVDENPCLADAWRALALIHWESGDRDRGRDFLDRALVLDPDNPLNQRTLDFFDSKKLR
jgi:tetratricopeptide (TPR) repeat protein